jgi:hypothetical protein
MITVLVITQYFGERAGESATTAEEKGSDGGVPIGF